MRSEKHSIFIPTETLVHFKNYVKNNNLVLQNADKYAGISVLFESDYKSEILKHLDEETIYEPSTRTHYEQSISEFEDKIKCLKIKFDNETELHQLTILNSKPCKFYILIKWFGRLLK